MCDITMNDILHVARISFPSLILSQSAAGYIRHVVLNYSKKQQLYLMRDQGNAVSECTEDIRYILAAVVREKERSRGSPLVTLNDVVIELQDLKFDYLYK